MFAAPGISTDRIKAIAAKVLSLEAAFALFIVTYTSMGRFSYIGPLSLRLLFFSLAVGLLLWGLLRETIKFEGPALKALALYLLLIAIVVLSSLWSLQAAPRADRVFTILLTCVPSFILALVTVRSEESRERFRIGMYLGTILALIQISDLYLGPRDQWWTVLIQEGGYQGLNRTLGVCAIVMAISFIFHSRSNLQRLIHALIFAALFAVMSLLGGTAGMLGLVVCLVPLFFVFAKFDRRGLIELNPATIAVFVLLIGAAAALIYISTLPIAELPFTLQRIAGKLHGTDARIAAGLVHKWDRIWIWSLTPQFWSAAPLFGNGVGSWSLLAGAHAIDGYYAHDFILEILGETGLAGFSALLALLFFIAWGYARSGPEWRDPSFIMCTLIGAFLVMQSLVMGPFALNPTHAGLGFLTIGLLGKARARHARPDHVPATA